MRSKVGSSAGRLLQESMGERLRTLALIVAVGMKSKRKNVGERKELKECLKF